MQKLLIWVSVILVILVGGKFVFESLDKGAYENSASTQPLDARGVTRDQDGNNLWPDDEAQPW